MTDWLNVQQQINLRGLFNAKVIIVVEQYWYYLTHFFFERRKDVHTFLLAIRRKVNVIAWLETPLLKPVFAWESLC